MHRTVWLVSLLLLSLFTLGEETQPSSQPKYEQDFAAGGHLKLELSAGDYDIRGVEGSKIRVFVSCTKNPDKVKEVKFSTAVAGSNGKLKITGPHNDIQYTVEVPARLDLTVRLSAGDVELRGVEGNTDVEMHAGDLNLHVKRPEDYAKVDLSVNIGDLNAGPWAVSKGGFVRSFHQSQTGKYKLHAHVGAGDLNVSGE
jgi:hypothetical protein